MTGKHVATKRCPFCGGRLRDGQATVPFVLRNSVVVVKDVPAEICASCHEPLMTGEVADELTYLLGQLRAAGSEVSLLSFQRQSQAALALAERHTEYSIDQDRSSTSDYSEVE